MYNFNHHDEARFIGLVDHLAAIASNALVRGYKKVGLFFSTNDNNADVREGGRNMEVT
jgi:hypothetical protein